MQPKPIAVLISDQHYALSTYEVADQAFRQAIDKAAELGVPLIDAGDISSDKPLIRAEWANVLLKTLEYAEDKKVSVYAVVGNHSLINEKGSEHALHFLNRHCTVVSHPTSTGDFHFIPYQSTPEKFMDAIQKFPKGSIVIGHQGTIGGQLGHYVKDSSAINPDDVKDWKVFLGHYHAHYTLGTTVSIGNPYTLTFGEASDPAKGFLVIYEDGSFERVQTKLRKHVIAEYAYEDLKQPIITYWKQDDLYWIKVTGSHSQLSKLNKSQLGQKLIGHSNFKLDLIYTDSPQLETKIDNMTSGEILDSLIDVENESTEEKQALKDLWREVYENPIR